MAADNSHSDTPQALKAWWAGFKNKKRKDEQPKVETPAPVPGIFGVPLAESIKYANVAISLMNDQGESFTYGYVPIIVAKCGVYLKEQATDVEGIFRLSGSAKRIKELQMAFDSPDRYGKGLDWTGFTVHDAANVLRRYLNNLPQPIIPLEFYERFREPLRKNVSASDPNGNAAVSKEDFNHDKAIATYQQLITEVPALNRQLLLYILDLLAVFASKSDVNLMTSANLAAIFQPGVLSHPTHDMIPEAYRLSQDVLIFLIDNQDSFLIGMSGTAADEKTVREVQSGAASRQQASPTRPTYGRSPSSGSPSGDGRRFSGLRRNVSTSSRNSKRSSQGPATPMSERFGNSSVYRSNTVPSKKSPALPTSRFSRGHDSPNTLLAGTPTSEAKRNLSPPLPAVEPKNADTSRSSQPVEGLGLNQIVATSEPVTTNGNQETTAASPGPDQLLVPPPKTRKVSDVLLNLTGGVDRDGRLPNKLKKKRLPSSTTSASENSSATSLLAAEQSPGFPPARSPSRTPDISSGDGQLEKLPIVMADSTNITPTLEESEPSTPIPKTGFDPAAIITRSANEDPKTPIRSNHAPHASDLTARPRSISRTSANSKSSITDHSEVDPELNDEAAVQQREKKRRWRFSHSAKQSKSPARVGSNVGADQSSSSIGSWHRSRKSISNETGSSAIESTTMASATSETHPKSRDRSRDKETEEEKGEKKGFFDKLKKKVTQAREDKKERDAEKERAKSPLRDAEQASSRHSLSAVAVEPNSPRKPSIVEQTILEQKEPETSPVAGTAMVGVPPAIELDAVDSATAKDEGSKLEPAHVSTEEQKSPQAISATTPAIPEEPLAKPSEVTEQTIPTIEQGSTGTTAHTETAAEQPATTSNLASSPEPVSEST